MNIESDRLSAWASLAQAILLLIGTFAVILTLIKMDNTNRLMTEANIAATKAANAAVAQVEALKRPSLKVRHEQIKGDVAEIAIENAGEAIAAIKASDFIVHIGDTRPVPRHWSFVKLNGRAPNKIPYEEIGTGNPKGWVYWQAPIPEGADKDKIVLMGGIIYTKMGDDRTYRTFFCRKYDPARQRFVAIEPDPEYERED